MVFKFSPFDQAVHILGKHTECYRSRSDGYIGAFAWVKVSWNMFNPDVPSGLTRSEISLSVKGIGCPMRWL